MNSAQMPKHIQGSLPTRRDLLRTGIAGAGTTLLCGQAVGDDEPQANSIDAHVHVWTPNTKSYPLAAGFTKADMQPPSFTPQELMAHAKPCGVARVVLIQMSFYGDDNTYMLA